MERHGGNLAFVESQYGISLQEILDFSANINPLGIPDALKDLFIQSMEAFTHYPDPHYIKLKTQIADYVGVKRTQIAVGNGASEIIFAVFDALRPKRVLMAVPTFSEYEQAVCRAGGEVVYFPLSVQQEFSLDVEALIKAMDGVDAVMLCNPNNPTAKLLTVLQLTDIVRFANKKNIPVIVDEAFIELTIGGVKNSVVPLLSRFDNLLVVRAFTKIFAIPGVRLGYLVSTDAWVKRVVQKLLPWSVNAVAIQVGEYLPLSAPYLAQTETWLTAEMDWLYIKLQNISYLHPFKPHTNFILAEIKSDLHAKDLKERLIKKNILIRDASNFVGLNEKFVRFAIKDRTANEALVFAL